MKNIVRKDIDITDTEVIENSRQLRFTISSETPDRDYDVISVNGWQLDNYKRNPVVLWAHDADCLPIGKVVDISVSGTSLKATVEFVRADVPVVGPKAEAVYQLLKSGFLSATSVGFQPLKFELSDRTSPTGKPGLNILSAELCELSIVTIPSNPDALIEQRSFKRDTDVNENAQTENAESEMRKQAVLRQRRQRHYQSILLSLR